VEAGFSKKGIDAYHGLARFKDQRSLQIGDEVLTARFVLIASGAIPARLGIEGEEHVITSTEFLELESLPRRIVFIGGGYVAAELSHIAARAGAAVTILQRGARMLPLFDPTLVEWLTERSREIGMDIRLRTQVLAVERKPSGFVVRGSADAGVREFECDLVVHAAGRVANIEALGVDLAGVETRGGKLVLNDHLQSVSNPAVYAAGDAASKGPPLTPVAAHDARLAASNMLEGNRHKVSYRGIPSVAFTIPPIASVGMSEQQARDGEYKFKVNVERASDWYTARRVAEPLYGFKVLIEEGTGLILGAHLVGPQVGEVINVIALAIRTGMTAKDLRDAVFAYPTGASDIGYMM
jgi:glutathione reductase (NADPH)